MHSKISIIWEVQITEVWISDFLLYTNSNNEEGRLYILLLLCSCGLWKVQTPTSRHHIRASVYIFLASFPGSRVGHKSLETRLVFSCGKSHAILSRINPNLYRKKTNTFDESYPVCETLEHG